MVIKCKTLQKGWKIKLRNLIKRHTDGKLERKQKKRKGSELKVLEREQRKGKGGNSQRNHSGKPPRTEGHKNLV